MSQGRRALLILGALTGLTAACGGARPRASMPTPAVPLSSADAAAHGPDYLDLLEAVFRHQFDHNASASGRNVDYFFLALEGDADPPPELLARFEGETPQVLPVSMSVRSMREGVTHRELGGRGLIFRIKSIAWVSDDKAVVEGGYYEGGLSASGNTYQVERDDGRWVVTSDRMNWIS